MESNKQMLADAQAGASAFLAGVTWVADLAIALQIVATAVAIVAGGAAAWYHLEKAMDARCKRRAELLKEKEGG